VSDEFFTVHRTSFLTSATDESTSIVVIFILAKKLTETLLANWKIVMNDRVARFVNGIVSSFEPRGLARTLHGTRHGRDVVWVHISCPYVDRKPSRNRVHGNSARACVRDEGLSGNDYRRSYLINYWSIGSFVVDVGLVKQCARVDGQDLLLKQTFCLSTCSRSVTAYCRNWNVDVMGTLLLLSTGITVIYKTTKSVITLLMQ